MLPFHARDHVAIQSIVGAGAKVCEVIGRKQRVKFDLNWISRDDVRSFCALSGLDLLTSESHQVIPFRLMGLGIRLING